MKTTINNSLRVFQVVTSTGYQFFCNLEQLNEVCKDLKSGYFKIYHFWNNKPKVVTKKYLAELFESNQIYQEFYY
jgi:hypothetical protein